jgi:hypothetical protein
MEAGKDVTQFLPIRLATRADIALTIYFGALPRT